MGYLGKRRYPFKLTFNPRRYALRTRYSPYMRRKYYAKGRRRTFRRTKGRRGRFGRKNNFRKTKYFPATFQWYESEIVIDVTKRYEGNFHFSPGTLVNAPGLDSYKVLFDKVKILSLHYHISEADPGDKFSDVSYLRSEVWKVYDPDCEARKITVEEMCKISTCKHLYLDLIPQGFKMKLYPRWRTDVSMAGSVKAYPLGKTNYWWDVADFNNTTAGHIPASTNGFPYTMQSYNGKVYRRHCVMRCLFAGLRNGHIYSV